MFFTIVHIFSLFQHSSNTEDTVISGKVDRGGLSRPVTGDPIAVRMLPQRRSRKGSSVIESYCGACGVFIAASSGPNLLELAERLHRARASIGMQSQDSFSSSEARIVSYLFGVGQTPSTGVVDDRLAHLLNELTTREPLLNHWLESSAMNARWFRKDPIAALRAANIGFNESMLNELENITASIAEKLRKRLYRLRRAHFHRAGVTHDKLQSIHHRYFPVAARSAACSGERL